MAAVPAIELTYFALPRPIQGRGGCVRSFMLAHNIKFTEKLVSFEEWGSLKTALADEGIKHMPFLTIDGTKYAEHVALMKLVARFAKVEVPTDPIELYAQDGIADAYAEWRGAWAKAKFGGDPAAEVDYKANLPTLLKEFDTLLKRYSKTEAFISGPQPLWADTALYSLLQDNITVEYLTEEGLKEYPRLSALYTAHKSIKEVAAWMEQK
mmetsp:Transcript_217/g.727  ORF Transcript_217/g.727 Transcript_217/m.727 type:complete len:210 (+) Transcript_217:62-691(+)